MSRFRFFSEDQILRLQRRQLTPSVILTVRGKGYMMGEVV